MTTIVTEHYPCGNCGATLGRPKMLSYSSFFGGEPDFLDHQLYYCEQCGYVGYDLSKEPSPEEKAIMARPEYVVFNADEMIYYEPKINVLMGYKSEMLGQYETAIRHYAVALDHGGFYCNQKTEAFIEDYVSSVDESGATWGFRAEHFHDQTPIGSGKIYVRERIFRFAKENEYFIGSPFALFIQVVDACRRNGHLQEAMDIISKRLKMEEDPVNRELLNEELSRCEKKDFSSIGELPPLK